MKLVIIKCSDCGWDSDIILPCDEPTICDKCGGYMVDINTGLPVGLNDGEDKERT
jgi:Zn finger protein HypA/HybF involved in hydrogenase expression